MKRYIKIYLATALTFVFSACSDSFLEFVPQDQATVAGWYRNQGEIRQATASLYGSVWFTYNDVFGWCASDLLAGDMHHNWDQEGQFFYLSYNESNTHIGDGWRGLYNVISYANLIIDDMPAVAGGYGVDAQTINAGLAEARFFRGFAYFLLTEYWEEVPIVENPAQKVATGNLRLPKNKAASLYEFARRDLAFAADNLPATDDPGRVTKWAAKGMLAKLHLSLAQRSVGGSDIGTIGDFATAAGLCAEVINNSGLTLFPNYEEMFKIPNEHNPEILFGIEWINAGWGTGNSRQARFARHSRITGDTQAWGGGKCMTISFLTSMEANAEGMTDQRRRAIYMQVGDHYDYINKKTGGYTYQIVSRNPDGSTLESQTPTLNSLKKYVVGSVDDHTYAITNQDSPLNNYMLRLADVYLMYAEALLAGGTSLSSGPGYQAYVNVRARAGLLPPTDGDMTYADLCSERRVELALEGLTWLDVKRRYYRNSADAMSYLNSQARTARYYKILNNNSQENDPAAYELVYVSGDPGMPFPLPSGSYDGVGSRPENENNDPVVQFTSGRMRMPIPANEVVSNPLLAPEVPAEEYVFE